MFRTLMGALAATVLVASSVPAEPARESRLERAAAANAD